MNNSDKPVVVFNMSTGNEYIFASDIDPIEALISSHIRECGFHSLLSCPYERERVGLKVRFSNSGKTASILDLSVILNKND